MQRSPVNHAHGGNRSREILKITCIQFALSSLAYTHTHTHTHTLTHFKINVCGYFLPKPSSCQVHPPTSILAVETKISCLELSLTEMTVSCRPIHGHLLQAKAEGQTLELWPLAVVWTAARMNAKSLLWGAFPSHSFGRYQQQIIASKRSWSSLTCVFREG
jgi:hypothetical protein